MATKDEKGFWIDAAGNHIPPKYVDQVDKKRDAMVEKLFRYASKTQDHLRKLKNLIEEDVKKYLAWLATIKGEKAFNPGGNYQFKTFYGDKEICVRINKVIEFDERLKLAKQKIDRCIEKWSEGANDKLKTVIFDAFKVNKKGQVDTHRILGLRTLKIKDKEWAAAMELISEAITITGSRKYLIFHEREDSNGSWKTIRLDLAGV